jgi:hypothetical protein
VWQKDSVATPYGPFIKEVKRIPASWDSLRSTADGIKYFNEMLPKSAPAVAVEIGRRDYERSDGTLAHSESTIEVVLYLLNGHNSAQIVGRYEPSDDLLNNMSDPGMDAMEDLIEARMLSTSPGPAFTRFIPVRSFDVWASPELSIRELRCSTTSRYRACMDRDVEQLEEIVVKHDVDGNGVIAEQRGFYA